MRVRQLGKMLLLLAVVLALGLFTGCGGNDEADTCTKFCKKLFSCNDLDNSICSDMCEQAPNLYPSSWYCCLRYSDCDTFQPCQESGGSMCPDDTPDPDPTEAPWYDSSSGLTWQNPPADGHIPWQAAKDYCSSLTHGGYSDWRLPTTNELRSLIRGCPATEKDGSCGVTDSCLSQDFCRDNSCNGCSQNQDPAVNGCCWPSSLSGRCYHYWSSSPREDVGGSAWRVNFDYGYVDVNFVGLDASARCVR